MKKEAAASKVQDSKKKTIEINEKEMAADQVNKSSVARKWIKSCPSVQGHVDSRLHTLKKDQSSDRIPRCCSMTSIK